MISTDLAPPAAEPAPLPLSAADLALVEGAVAWLNRTVQASGVQLAVEVSGYLLATFFGGDFAAFADHDRKPVSFRALLRHQQLQLGHGRRQREPKSWHSPSGWRHWSRWCRSSTAPRC